MSSSTNPTHETTEWEDLQVKYGNFEERVKPVTGEELTSLAIDFAEQQNQLSNKSLKELNELEDEIEEDTLDVLRKKRIKELQDLRSKARFGDVEELTQSEYVQKVTTASTEYWVVVHLYQDYHENCKILDSILHQTAKAHPDVRFYRGVATKIVSDSFPDRSLPTLLLYRHGGCFNQIGGKKLLEGGPLSFQRIEKLLKDNGVVNKENNEDDIESSRLSTKTTVPISALYKMSENDGLEQEERRMDRSMHSDDREYMSLHMKAQYKR